MEIPNDEEVEKMYRVMCKLGGQLGILQRIYDHFENESMMTIDEFERLKGDSSDVFSTLEIPIMVYPEMKNK